MSDYNPYSLSQKTILVTGASSGIGQGVANESAKLGARLVITGRDETRLAEVLNGLVGDGHKLVRADLTNRDDRDALVASLPHLDGISHNAGIGSTSVFRFLNEDILHRVFEANFHATFMLQRSILKAKLLARGGSVVLMGSRSAHFAAAGLFSYSTSKGAMSAGSRVLALELASQEIRVNCISPGMVRTRFLVGGALTEEQFQQDEKKYPLGRYGTPEDVAWMVCYLLSDASRWVTGVDFCIDGGRALN